MNIQNLLFVVLLFICGCTNQTDNKIVQKSTIASSRHDVGYTPIDLKLDDENFVVCDSTRIYSGRNRIQYADGSAALKKECMAKFVFKPAYKPFNGYIVVRFMINCQGETGRFRAESLDLDFSTKKCSPDLLEHSIQIVKNIDTWVKSSQYGEKREYSKYINFKFKNGKIEHVLL